ncbi:hypothetical protein OSB04_020106 [Centaurea solstitialis]|uniref:Uncharacterized protein n=1 Tax=Centaurea solstitialis TaxID=347529 RepID=A0AA38SZ67_9ASTR|nr:hypothetical protein OSB04_020106 [Centaurea solstitialis]
MTKVYPVPIILVALSPSKFCRLQRSVAEIRSKEAKGGTVALGMDVFRLVVQPLIDSSLSVALVIIHDQMFGSSRGALVLFKLTGNGNIRKSC